MNFYECCDFTKNVYLESVCPTSIYLPICCKTTAAILPIRSSCYIFLVRTREAEDGQECFISKEMGVRLASH